MIAIEFGVCFAIVVLPVNDPFIIENSSNQIVIIITIFIDQMISKLR